jgi:hypothetical protein
MLTEIGQMTDPPMTRQHTLWLMRQPGAPAGVRLARGTVYRGSEVLAFLREHLAQAAAGWRPIARDPSGRFRGKES